MSVYKKLIDVQCELKAPKNQYNSFGKYSYRSCEDILEALKPVCSKHGATTFITDRVVNIENRFYVEATVTFVDVETGESVKVTAMAREEENKKGMDASQITGSTSSYARKYALNGMFCIDDTKDADATNDHGKGQKQQQSQNNNVKPRTITAEQQSKLFFLASGKDNQKIASIIKKYGFEKSTAITVDKFDVICKEIENL